MIQREVCRHCGAWAKISIDGVTHCKWCERPFQPRGNTMAMTTRLIKAGTLVQIAGWPILLKEDVHGETEDGNWGLIAHDLETGFVEGQIVNDAEAREGNTHD